MRILMSFGRRAGLPALLALLLSGCYIPGGGWTLRGGADLRTRYKPTVFVEMVDSRWDEYNRVACANTQCQPRSGGKSGTGAGTGTATDSSGHSGCLLGLPMPGVITPVPSTGPTLAPGYGTDPSRNTAPNDAANGTQPNAIPQSPLPQYQLPNPAAPQYPVPQPFPNPNDVPPDPSEDVPGNAPRNEPNPVPGVTATGQSYPTQYGAWPGPSSGPALMLPAPDPVIPAYGDSGLNSQGPTEPASATSANSGLELSSYEQAGARGNANRFTAGSKIAPNGRRPVRRQYSSDPTDPSGANRHFTRPRM